MIRDEVVQCHYCQRTYSRPEHLRRHFLVHSSQSPHECPRCQRPFQRKDTLGRHLNTCLGRSKSSVLCHDRACRRCAIRKRKCNHEKPSCKACSSAGVACQYPNQVLTDSSMFESNAPETALPSPAATPANNETSPVRIEEALEVYLPSIDNENQPRLHISNFESVQHSPLTGASLQVFLPSTLSSTKFSFLLDFTTHYSLRGSFGTLFHPQFPPPNVQPPSQHDAANRSEQNSLKTHCSSSSTLRRGTSGRGTVQNNSEVLQTQVLRSDISCGIHEVLEPIVKRQGRTVRRHCLKLFSPESIVYCLDLYWSNWHPNWPVIHKPTFRADRCPSALLAAMVVVGSCYLNPDNACDWFDAIEDLAFDELQLIPHSASLYRKTQSLQAAYLACIFQTWDGGKSARTRIRRNRFASIVTAARDLDMSTVRHSNIASCLEYFDWIEFVHMEECIRTLLWVFQLDTAYIIFNNMPPHFALRELSMGLASPELSFQASSPHECFAILRAWLANNARTFDPSLYGLIKLFFKPELGSNVLHSLAHESFMNLWCVNAAFHVVLFNLDPVLGGEQQFSGLQTGIDNWQAVWKQRMVNNDERFFDSVITTMDFSGEHVEDRKPWQCPGFWKNAAEYWLLAQVMLSRMIEAHHSAAYADELSGCTASHVNIGPHIHERIEDAEMHSLHSFLAVLSTTVTMSLNSYDHRNTK